MTAQFTGEEILEITGGRLAAGMAPPEEPGQICTDSRRIKPGDWYLALSGERFDGHDFLGDAFSAGAVGAIVAERPGYAIGNPQFPLIAVDNTIDAYHALARNWRRRINPFVIGVTGSSGKTTTKEMCATVFSAAFRYHKSRENENNEIGVGKTLLSMPDDTQVLIVEMAMRGLGQIDQLARCALPDVAIITNAGTAHLELLGSVENIAKAKSEILKYLPKGRGYGVIGQPTERLLTAARAVWDGPLELCTDDAIEVAEVTAETTIFRVKGCDKKFEVRVHGRPLLEDAWCVVTTALKKGIDPELIARALRMFNPVTGRGNRLVGANGALILDETYNANPDSVKASVGALLDQRAFPQQQKIVVLGELAELGSTEAELHRELGTWLKDKQLSLLITVGRLARNIAEGAQGAAYNVVPCADQAEAEKTLRSILSADTCVLIKGSHRANLDKLVQILVTAAVLVCLFIAPAAVASDFPGVGSAADWSDALPYYNLGNKRLNEGRFAEAAESYREAVARYSYDPDFLINLGVACQKSGDFLGAEQAFRSATALSPKDWSAWMNLGNAYLKQNRLRETLKAFETALKLNPPPADRKFLVSDIEDIHRVMRNLGQEPMPGAAPAKHVGATHASPATTKPAVGATHASPARTKPTVGARLASPANTTTPAKDWGYE